MGTRGLRMHLLCHLSIRDNVKRENCSVWKFFGDDCCLSRDNDAICPQKVLNEGICVLTPTLAS
jgi:hypothetical protein